MALHPQCKAFLDQLSSGGGKPLHDMTPVEARTMSLPPELAGPERPIHRVVNRTVPGPAGPIPVRVYTPTADRHLPGLVYFHGGGFVLGTLESSDRPCRDLAHLSSRVVVSVDYRLAPEHPFPAAVEDAYAATKHVVDHADEFGIDPARVAIGGESAGGNLAAVTAIAARDTGPRLTFQLLIYPQVDFDDDSPSMREFANNHFITTELIDYFARHYLKTAADRIDHRVSPLHADLHGLPPAFVLTAECDPLRDQGEEYAHRLERAGVRVGLKRYDGMIHPFFSLSGIIEGGKVAIGEAAAALIAAEAAAAH